MSIAGTESELVFTYSDGGQADFKDVQVSPDGRELDLVFTAAPNSGGFSCVRVPD